MTSFDKLAFEVVIRPLCQSTVDDISVEDVVSIPEADVALCRFNHRRFNVKFDLDYGLEVEAVDQFSDAEISLIKKIITMNATRGESGPDL